MEKLPEDYYVEFLSFCTNQNIILTTKQLYVARKLCHFMNDPTFREFMRSIGGGKTTLLKLFEQWNHAVIM